MGKIILANEHFINFQYLSFSKLSTKVSKSIVYLQFKFWEVKLTTKYHAYVVYISLVWRQSNTANLD